MNHAAKAMAERAIDAPTEHPEYQRLLRGLGQFTDDIDPAGVCFMQIVRAPQAHADIVSIDTAAASAVPGVLAVLTGRELAEDGIGGIPCVSRPRRADFSVQDIIQPFYAALVWDRVRMVGEAVAVVVAETANAARNAAELVGVEYDMLPAVSDCAAAVAPGAPQLWPQAPGNVSFTYTLGRPEEVAIALASAKHVVRQRLAISRVLAAPLEPRAAIGAYDARTGRYTLRVGHQTPHQLRHVLARQILHVPEHCVRVISPDVGGAFGLKSGLFAEDILALWAARRCGRVVKWTCTRAEAFLSDDHARESTVEAALALDADGRFLALGYRGLANLGAYVALRGAHPPTNNLGSLSGTYVIPAVYAEVKGVFTNTRPTASYRGAGRPEATYVLERMIDLAAVKLGVDAFDLRRRNLIAAAQMPYHTGLLFTYDSGDFAANMNSCAQLVDRDGFARRRTESRASGRLRGLGFANAIEQAGGPVGAPWEERAELRFDLSGGVRVLVGTMASGQNHVTAYRQIVSSCLGIDPGLVDVVQGDTDVTPFGRGSFGSRSMMTGGSAITRACDKVIAKARQLAGFLLQAEPATLLFADGRFSAPLSGGAVTMAQVVQAAFNVAVLPEGLEGGLDTLATFAPPAPTYPNSCHACEIDIDPETGILRILRYVVVDDVGVVLDHASVEGQVQGGVAQGMGQALCEAALYDGDGQLLTGSFMDYAMPRASDVPQCELTARGTPTTNNPLGAKGAGEAGTIGAIPAVMNAVADALAPLGIAHLDMPASPHRIWQAINSARQRHDR